jgi:flagellar biosynthesis/type III secretory pathway M-ring protein FliF/YscJ
LHPGVPNGNFGLGLSHQSFQSEVKIMQNFNWKELVIAATLVVSGVVVAFLWREAFRFVSI